MNTPLITRKEIIANKIIMEEAGFPLTLLGYLQVYGKGDDCLYIKNGDGVEHLLGGRVPSFKSYTFRSKSPGRGRHYVGGFYHSPATDAKLSEVSPSISYGESNHPYASHAFAVSSGNGITNGIGLTLTVSGTSITDTGEKIEDDSQVIIADVESSALDGYYETSKKWLGVVTFTLSSRARVFSFDFDFGLCKYDDWGNRDFLVTDFECTGKPYMDDPNFDVELLHHRAIDWKYHATDFIPGTPALLRMSDIHGAYSDLVSAEPFAFKLVDQSYFVNGSDSEGVIIRITTGADDVVSYMNMHIGIDRR